jgi:integrase
MGKLWIKDKITEARLKALQRDAVAAKAGLYLMDTKLAGFGCRCSPKGAVSWLTQKWLAGKIGRYERVVFGHYPAIGVEEAREQARNLVGRTDLVERKKAHKDTERAQLDAPKLDATVTDYLGRKAVPGERYWDELTNRFKNEIVLALGKDKAVAAITKQDVRKLIRAKEAEGYPVAARTLFEALRPFFKWCVDEDLIPASPMADLKAPKLPEARERVLTDAEVKSIWRATETEPLFGPFYRLLLLTMQRREEVAGMRWDELDLEAHVTQCTWTIPKERTKNGKAHLVHLSLQALTVLGSIPRGASPYVFSTTGETSISGYSKAKVRIDKAMGIVTDPEAEGYDPAKLWRVHDLRRTAASGIAALGFMPHVIERVLNHISGAQGGLIGVYQRHEYLEDRKQAMHAWGAYIDRLINVAAYQHSAGAVLTFRRA